ncbi:MAG TPA: TonB family protein [Steroidobacteraceae bacterium]|nr:TonB family protein [Steroidobacteraceae bacterium]
MSALVQRGSTQGRPMALAVTIALHVALVAGLLAMKVVEVAGERATPPIDVSWVKERRPTIPPEKPIRPTLVDPRGLAPPDIPVPDVPLGNPVEPIPVDTQPLSMPGEDAVSVEPTTVVADTPLRYQAVRPSDDYYPPQAIRMGAEGVAVVRACVDAGGQLSAAPSVVRSSRQSLLDAAAVKWASEALRFQPATRSGAAIAACREFRVSFTLH